LPRERDADFVFHLEDILAVYHRPLDPARPLVCLDEMSKTLVAPKRAAQAVRPGQPAREDYTYENLGWRNLFLAYAPLQGHRVVKVTEHRTRKDWAHFIRELVEQHYREAEKIVLVLDNLNTHTQASLYETFAPSVARRLCEKLEIHYTPKHASWLNMAEIELSVLARKAVNQRVDSVEQFIERVEQWQRQRNNSSGTVSWHFTTADARIKLKRLYPVPQPVPRQSAPPGPVTN
jgi:DDE superfamily endonuclease